MDTTVDQRFRPTPNRPVIGAERSGDSTPTVVRLGVRIQRFWAQRPTRGTCQRLPHVNCPNTQPTSSLPPPVLTYLRSPNTGSSDCMIRFCVDGVLSYVPIWSRGVRPSVTGGQTLEMTACLVSGLWAASFCRCRYLLRVWRHGKCTRRFLRPGCRRCDC